MCKAGATRSLIFRANVVPEVYRCDRCGAINHSDQAKAVGEPALFQWNRMWTRHACLPPLVQRDQRKEDRTEKPNGEPLCGNDQRRAAISGECGGVDHSRHVANLLKVEGAGETVRHAETSARLDPADCGASERERNKEAWSEAARCTECKERGAEEKRGDESRYSGALTARDLLRTDIAGAGDVLKLHAYIVAASGVPRR